MYSVAAVQLMFWLAGHPARSGLKDEKGQFIISLTNSQRHILQEHPLMADNMIIMVWDQGDCFNTANYIIMTIVGIYNDFYKICTYFPASLAFC